jgi:predicted nucleic acid-binding protein
MAVIISDAGPLIALAGIHHLDILRTLFNNILIPEAVWQECTAKQDEAAQAITDATRAGWLEVRETPAPQGFAACLGDGERSAIQLAETLANAVLIMDDRLARREALQRKLLFIGTAKVLWTAQQRGIIPDAANLISLMAENGYHISPKLLEQMHS